MSNYEAQSSNKNSNIKLQNTSFTFAVFELDLNFGF
jgi:hypothetical protein